MVEQLQWQFSELSTQDTMNFSVENWVFMYLIGNIHQQTNNDQQYESNSRCSMLKYDNWAHIFAEFEIIFKYHTILQIIAMHNINNK